MSDGEKIQRIIKRLLDQGHMNFLIFPYSCNGNRIKRLLNETFGIHERGCSDFFSYKDGNICVTSVNELKSEEHSGCIILFGCKPGSEETSDIRYKVLMQFDISRIIDVLSPSMYFDRHVFYDETYFSNPRKMFFESCSRELYANGIEGNVAECGVFQGDSACVLNELFPERTLYLFDTFEGYDNRDMTVEEYRSWGEYMIQCHNRFRQTFSTETLLKKMPWRKNVVIKKGYFPKTAMSDIGIADGKYAFVNLDMNLYHPMMAGLEFFWKRLVPGGTIFVDDIRHEGLPSPRKALMDFCLKNNIAYTTMTYNGMGIAAISKPLNERKPCGTDIRQA